jgi:hypothetical protein
MNKQDQSKFSDFVEALRLLCKQHGVSLSPTGYDALQVWDLGGQGRPDHIPGCRRLHKLLPQSRRNVALALAQIELFAGMKTDFFEASAYSAQDSGTSE